MKTTFEAKQKYIEKGSPIAVELVSLNPSVIVDCGACDGLDSLIYSRLFPNAKIYAIEAREDNMIDLHDTIAQFHAENIVPIQACLSNDKGNVSFWLSSGQSGNVQNWDTGNKSSSLFYPKDHIHEHPWCHFRESKIETVRFDQLGIDLVDFLHLDVQGAELKVLGGFGEVLKTLKAVWLEIACVELYGGQPLKKDIEAFMEALGFKKIIDKSNRREGDQLWVR